MTAAFASAIRALFADGSIARDATYIADGGTTQRIRVVSRRADEISSFGDARIWSEATRIDLRVAEVPAPRPGDRIEIDGNAFLILGEPGIPGCVALPFRRVVSVQRRRDEGAHSPRCALTIRAFLRRPSTDAEELAMPVILLHVYEVERNR